MKKQSFFQRVKSHPIFRHLLLIAGVMVALVLVAYIAMSVGTRHSARRAVPNFEGVLIDDAIRTAESRDLEIIINDSLHVPTYPGGTVLDQLPNGNVVVKPGRKVYVTINSYRQRMVNVPFVAGRSLRQAINMLEAVGLEVERIDYVEDIATNYVLAEYLGEEMITEESDLKAELGSGIRLQVGVAPDAKPLATPLLLGRNMAEAKSRLWESGLNVGALIFDEGILAVERSRAKVYSQSVMVGESIEYGSSITLYFTLDDERVSEAVNAHEKAAQRAREVADSLANAEKEMLRQAEEAKAQQGRNSNNEDEFLY